MTSPHGESPARSRGAVVTGAAGGIGLAVVRRLASEGIAVLAVDRDGCRLEHAVGALTAERGPDQPAIRALVADLSTADGRDAVVPAALQGLGRVDVLVNNAADHGRRVCFLDLAFDEWERVVATNLTATAVLSQQAARDMRTRGSGAIVNITAIQERLPLATYVAYGASKGGISALTRAMAAELSPLGIRVNAVAPGMISTPSLDSTRDDSPSPTLLGRDGTPDEVAEAVSFLVSDRAAFITGTILTVDGGRTISRRHDPLSARFDSLAEEHP